jgi:hypothetical protein
MTKSDTNRKTRLQRIPGGVGRYAVRCAAGISTFTLGATVAAMAVAGGKFKAAPVSAEAEAAAAAAADSEPTMILGYDVNTLFFVAAGAIAVFWFTLGGGRKPKVSRE